MTTKVRGADLVVRALDAAGVSKIFTLSGNHIMPIFDATIGTRLELVHVRHEGAAVHMADAWGRWTGRPGIALVTGGPGHANAVGALYTALAAESPMVLLSGHAPTDELGLGAFQEMAQAEMAAPAAKASWTATQTETLADDVARALEIAASGRPGPVHVSLPSDLLDHVVDPPSKAGNGRQAADPEANPEALAALTRLIAEAQRPLLVAGPRFDSVTARNLLDRVATAHDIAVAVMASPRGINDPSLGAFASVLKAADLVVMLGKPLDFTLRFGRSGGLTAESRIALIETDGVLSARAARAFGDRLAFHLAADPMSVARTLAGAPPRPANRRADLERGMAHRPQAWQSVTATSADRLHPAEMCRTIAEVVARHPEAIVVADGGEIGQWAQAMIPTRRRIINGVAGSIGAALPFAIAARLAEPKAPVIAVMGDGTFGFHMAEIDTAVRHGAPFVAVIGNDARWNAEHQIQLRSYGVDRTIGCGLLPTAYDRVAVALGGDGRTVTRSDELARHLERALGADKPVCLNVPIESVAAPVVAVP